MADIKVTSAGKEIDNLLHDLDLVTKAKDQAYWERDQLVFFLCKLFPAHLALHPEEDKEWDYDWRWIVCIHTPAGTLCWHIPNNEHYLFEHFGLKIREDDWDGSTTIQKYDRLKAVYPTEEVRFYADNPKTSRLQ